MNAGPFSLTKRSFPSPNALHVTPASAQDRGEVETLARTTQAVPHDSIEIAWAVVERSFA